MKNELGIEICGENCKGDVIPNYDCPKCGQKKCGDENCQYFEPKLKLLKQRIIELQEQIFTKKEAEKVETFLTHGYKMMVNKNKKIFSKLKKKMGANNE